MKELEYQTKYIDELVQSSIKYFLSDDSKLIVFQAPTGSGKTIMLAESISRIVKEKKNLSFVWISVNALHEQSKKKLEQHFEAEGLLDCISINELDNNEIKENQILFVNWESLNKEENVFMVDNERDWNLSSIIEKTKEEDRDIVLIIDESHRAAKTSKSKEIISVIAPKLTIEVSATPKDDITNDLKITVPLKEVIAEGMIKQEIQINAGISKAESNEDIVLAALKKRKQLHKSFQEMGKNINPLLLIQIPRKRSTDVRSPEEKIIDILEKHNVNTKNGKLAIWLAENDKKINLDYLEKDDSDVEVLIFKEAIALGWDCPRASILLLQREWNVDNYEFNIQTLGRIMRMPEHMHYEKYPELNVGFVYSASDNFSIVEDLAKDYVSKVQMLRNNLVYKNINLPSQSIRRKREKTRLSGVFKDCLIKSIPETDFKNINLSEVKFTKKVGSKGKIKDIDQEKKQSVEFTDFINVSKDREEVFTAYNEFVKSQTFPFSPARSIDIIKSSIRSAFKKTFNLDNEDKIAGIVMNPVNTDTIVDLIDFAKQKYKDLPEKEDIVNTDENWQVPEVISVFDNFEEQDQIKKSILEPYYVKKDKNNKLEWSKPEKLFVEELEKTDNDVQWWYKNGQRESKFFGIAYKKEDGFYYGFYPDYVIKTKKDIIVIEIKDDKDFKNENLLKLNAGRQFEKKYKGDENLKFYILSPLDYYKFFFNLKNQSLDSFKSKYEENLLKYAQSKKVTKEDEELIELYEEELKIAIKNLEDQKLEKEILKIDLDNAQAIIKSLKESLSYTKTSDTKDENLTLAIPKPFNICILGEVADEDIIRNKTNSFFSKYGLKATDWDIVFVNNTKLKHSNILNSLKKGQSKYNLIITGQIFSHSGKGNKSANILTELNNPKYVTHIVGSSPKELLTVDDLIEKLDAYLVESYG
jgi:type III restriction enzyme